MKEPEHSCWFGSHNLSTAPPSYDECLSHGLEGTTSPSYDFWLPFRLSLTSLLDRAWPLHLPNGVLTQEKALHGLTEMEFAVWIK
jgi:hypothetical protein